MAKQLRIMVIGAHPDDPDAKAAGAAALWAQAGHQVRFVSATNGDSGHHEIGGVELARRRYAEAQDVAKTLGIEYLVLDNHDGELYPSVETRRQFIRVIREFSPDLILTHRPNDYHPDHRYTSILVQDSCYMVTVPNIVSLTQDLRINPAVAYLSDHFQKPYPFTPAVVVDIDSVIEKKIDALHCHESQMYEWLPYNGGYLDQVPADKSLRRAWMAQVRGKGLRSDAERFRDKLIELYGPERGAKVQYAEAFEPCEYGSPLTPEKIRELFPFF